jgi:signal transduction histidine kinase/FixJ family two-component response regulator
MMDEKKTKECGKKMKILAVDDDVRVRRMLNEMLTSFGYECRTATNGKEALDVLKKGHFPILISDIRMPGMDGIELLKEIRENYSGIDVINITGYGDDYTFTDMIKAGASDFISKPFFKDELEAKIKRIVRERELNQTQNQMENELKGAKDHLDNMIESSLDCIIVTDSKGYLNRVNKSFLEMLGYREEEIVGKHITETTPMNKGETYECTTGELVLLSQEYVDDAKTMIFRFIEEGKVSNWESYYFRKDKKLVPVEQNIVCLFNEEGERTDAVAIIRDITERKKAEKELQEATIQLVQSEKLSSLGELTAGVAHEISQPLNHIKIVSQSLLLDIKRGRFEREDLEKDLQDVVGQVNKMAEIIDHMRIFTRRSEGKSQEMIEVNSIVEGAFKFLGQQLKNHNIEVREELSSGLPQVVGDPIRLEQVFLNLVSNARNAVESSGKEHMKIEASTYAINTNGDSSVVIEVKDNGNGISEELKEKIFQPFFTTKDPGKGTGLGLSVSNKIIEEHNGKMELDSTVGEGAAFRVILPAVE